MQSKVGSAVFSSFSEGESSFLAGKTTLRCRQSHRRRGVRAHLLKCGAVFLTVRAPTFDSHCHDQHTIICHL
ncbi:hypothetical protein [Hydrogenophaga sp. PBL-H3]|uniref:hypothetical protein n=1 Tax=Hydrogenophaga sp. PBL-H3 TaxID=434010 RepID=UPI0013200089|nr:hypothetical protein [Hydrogenophaga sp. PBL-H3]QHE76263.1 hypothetical protein F9Z45_09435 [Hydrogenophaga sp. PBL-H3]QHE80687.1 hypothetical protein F9Z44_09435 [Hydrogenophaga sp. PBL-H3]